jgi:putative endonuclease
MIPMSKPHGSFSYVYRLVSLAHSEQCYTGFTDNLEARLSAHNAGECTHTSKYLPWQIDTAIAFRSRNKALAFEKYLKTGSGRAFAKRHF